MCLSFIGTPCSLYTCCTDSSINCWAATSPFIFSISCGDTGPSVIFAPFSISISFVTTRCSPTGTVYSLIIFPDSGSSIVISLIPFLFLSENTTRPATSVRVAFPFGLRASNNSCTLGRPPVISLFPSPVFRIFVII